MEAAWGEGDSFSRGLRFKVMKRKRCCWETNKEHPQFKKKKKKGGLDERIPQTQGSSSTLAWVSTQSHQSYQPLCDPIDCNLPGCSVHEILQAKILKWVAMPSSWGSSRSRGRICLSPESPALQADSLSLSHQGSPTLVWDYGYHLQPQVCISYWFAVLP